MPINIAIPDRKKTLKSGQEVCNFRSNSGKRNKTGKELQDWEEEAEVAGEERVKTQQHSMSLEMA